MSCDKDGTTVVQSFDPASPAGSPPSDRAQLPVWPSTRPTWPSPCGLCSAGVLGKRGCSLESVTARICREAGGTVATNVMVRDLDLAAFAGADGRRSEVDGLPLFGGSQLAVDALVSALHANSGSERRRSGGRSRSHHGTPEEGTVPARGWSRWPGSGRKMVSGDTASGCWHARGPVQKGI